MKKFFSTIALLVVINIILVSCHLIRENYEPKIYHDSQEIVGLFRENIDDFSMVAKILYANEIYDELCAKDDGVIFDPYDVETELKKHLNTEECCFVFEFFEKYSPYQISYDYDYLCIVFLKGNGHSTVFYYIPDQNKENLNDTLIYLEQRGDCEYLVTNWYYSIH
ncbi:MAG: hypothetical protein IKA62_04060 [Clostridia bacterium]|nr:hypothetical protein [Clostridia bacterium]